MGWVEAAAIKKDEHSVPVDQFEPVFGLRTNQVLNFENPATAAVAHRGIAARGCREVAGVHFDIDGARCFDVLAARLSSSG